jgi:hypothetical protein
VKQLLAPWLEKVPGKHTAQDVAPNWPGAQTITQLIDEVVPVLAVVHKLGHETQLLPPVAAWNWPTGQPVQLRALPSIEKLPAAQLEQSVDDAAPVANE